MSAASPRPDIPAGATGTADKPDRRAELLGVAIALTVWAALFVLARIYTMLFKTKSFGWDDGFIVIATAASLAGLGLTCAGVSHGQGQTIQVLDLSEVPQVLKYSNFAIFCNGIAMCTMKIGIGISMLRLQLSKTFNIAVYVAITLSVIVNLTVFFSCFATCRPIERIWNIAVDGKCWPSWSSLVFSYTQTVGNIVTDLLFTMGPLYYLRKVKVSRYNKWALRGVFLIGLTATAMAIAKATELPALRKTRDPTYDAINLTIWVKAELSAGLFAASLPPLKATFEKVLIKVFRVRTGLTTPSDTFKSGYGTDGGGYGGGTDKFRSKQGTIDVEHGRPEYVGMTSVSRNRGARDPYDDGISIEEDQKHILHNNGGGANSVKTGSEDDQQNSWITKTVEYTVNESNSIREPPSHTMGIPR